MGKRRNLVFSAFSLWCTRTKKGTMLYVSEKMTYWIPHSLGVHTGLIGKGYMLHGDMWR